MPNEKKSRNDAIVEHYEDKGYTYEQIGAKFGITRQRVGQILKSRNVQGDKSNRGRDYSQEELISMLHKFAYEEGEKPTARNWVNQDKKPSPKMFFKKFGSWKAALHAAGIEPPEPKHRMDRMSDEELIEYLRDAADIVGRPSPQTFDEIEDDEFPHSRTIIARFGTWREALDKAGYKVNFDGKYGPDREFTNDDLIEKMNVAIDELGRTPTITEWSENYSPPSAILYRHRFGSWTKAKQAAYQKRSN